MSFQMVPKSVTLNDLQWRNSPNIAYPGPYLRGFTGSTPPPGNVGKFFLHFENICNNATKEHILLCVTLLTY